MDYFLIELLRVHCIFWIQGFYQRYLLQTFSLSLSGLSLYFLDSVFCGAEVINFNRRILSNISLVTREYILFPRQTPLLDGSNGSLMFLLISPFHNSQFCELNDFYTLNKFVPLLITAAHIFNLKGACI